MNASDRRRIGFADHGPPDGHPVIACHGGPGSRLEPLVWGATAGEVGLRIIGIDRPGYGASDPRPGRTIADWSADALTVADELGLDRFAVVGVSTGGSYAAALAAMAPSRVTAALLCCSITDLRWSEGRSMMLAGADETTHPWLAPDRDAAIAIAEEQWGPDGLRSITRAPQILAEREAAGVGGDDIGIGPSDVEMFSDPAFLAGMVEQLAAAFAQGAEGYADDRLADGDGWWSFDVSAITCPVTILHGSDDRAAPLPLALHTSSLIPAAELRIVEGSGHFSVLPLIVPTLSDLLRPELEGAGRG